MVFSPQVNVSISAKDIASFVLDNPKYDVDKPIYIDALDQSRWYSGRKARTAVRQLVAGFHALGLKQGDCVLINSMADIDYSILFLSIIAAGGIVCGSNPYYSEAESLHQLKRVTPRFIFTEAEFLDKMQSCAAKCEIGCNRIFIFDHRDPTIPGGFRSWRRLLEYGDSDWVRFTDDKTSRHTIAAYVMSSGTTGLPKAVVLSHCNIVAALTLGYDQERKDFEVRRILCFPQFATAAIYSNHFCPLRHGEVCFVMRRYETTAFLQNISKFNITEISVLPPILVQILQNSLGTKETLRSLRYVHGGGAAMPKPLVDRLRSLLPEGTPCTSIWGLSEASGIGTCFFWPEHDDTGSIGRLLPGLSAKLIDREGNDTSKFNNRGELCIKGPTVMLGYLNDAVSTNATIDPEEWLRTGDICYCDARTKKWYIVDRIKDLIKVNAFQVAPAELEEILLQHPDIADAAVIGIDAPEAATELPRAYVVPRQPTGAGLTEDMVKAFVAAKVVKYKRLEGGVRFVSSIPKALSGKILKNPLRDLARKESKTKL
ncbi:uncharacterized protein A1O5_01332 [Cladophialophora psammophila CBS 110553]|uniref:4-coumarate-CoA ligase n=1 Tax=Cladophialophora psammophila CBS 110553 TaxID=1182543 RepID=W9XWJ7_9EURO|nr:uncharacterized protein A1O5_01332 [Cladophialophora psammophila CBS 110553]EXJ74639.1 hypothetical protein A1O5_01332 [Cladophialophora psammophila CBS 110553]